MWAKTCPTSTGCVHNVLLITVTERRGSICYVTWHGLQWYCSCGHHECCKHHRRNPYVYGQNSILNVQSVDNLIGWTLETLHSWCWKFYSSLIWWINESEGGLWDYAYCVHHVYIRYVNKNKGMQILTRADMCVILFVSVGKILQKRCHWCYEPKKLFILTEKAHILSKNWGSERTSTCQYLFKIPKLLKGDCY